MATAAYTTMWTYPWDVVDEGVDETLRFLKNEVGLTAISLATAYHSFQQLRPHAHGRPTWHASTSAIYFQPSEHIWRESPLRPRVSPAMGNANWLASIAEGCRRHGLALTSWTVCVHSSWVAEQHPEAAVRSVFGDPSPAYLCPSSSATHAYLVALARDLRQTYGVDAIEIESIQWHGWQHGLHPKVGVALDALDTWLLGLCFCDACVEAARRQGADVDAVRAAIQARLRETFARGKSATPAEGRAGNIAAFVDTTPGLDRFLRAREESVLAALDDLRHATDAPLYFIAMGDRLASGVDLARVLGRVAKMEILAYSPSTEQVERVTREAVAASGDPRRLVAGLSAAHPFAPDAATLTASVRVARALGVQDFSFYNYGMIPRPHFAWIAQALGGS